MLQILCHQIASDTQRLAHDQTTHSALPLIVLTALAAWFGMDDLAPVKASFEDQAVIFMRKHNWILSWLYLGTFGSYIGFAAGVGLALAALWLCAVMLVRGLRRFFPRGPGPFGQDRERVQPRHVCSIQLRQGCAVPGASG